MPISDPTQPTDTGLSTAIAALRAAAESADGDAVGDLLAADVVFHSPLTSRIRFEGKDEVAALHRDIFAVIEKLSTTEPLTRGDTGAFSFSGAFQCAASSGLEPEIPGAKIRWATDYPTRQDVSPPPLTRQDSNLNRLIQNQPCYRLHHGSMVVAGLVRVEGFEPPLPEDNCFTGSRD
jgi:hypothetical protein